MSNPIATPNLARRRRIADTLSAVGFVCLAIGLFLPVFDLFSVQRLSIFKWIFTAGALTFVAGKCIPKLPKDTSIRLRRMYRLEFWAGICFCVGAFFWFFNEMKFSGVFGIGSLTIIHDTILYAMSGAVVEVIAVWMIYFREKKEAKDSSQS